MQYKVMIGVFLTISAMLAYQGFTIYSLEAERERLSNELLLSQNALTDAKEKIASQNDKIAQYAIDTQAAFNNYQHELSQLRVESGRVRTQIVQRLVKDPSCEERLAIIDEQLRGFLWAE